MNHRIQPALILSALSFTMHTHGEIPMKHLQKFYAHKHVLVTGGCGFIGSHIAQILVNIGAQVTILDDLSSGTLENIADFKDQVTFIHDSITNFDACLQATKNQEIVFHEAAFISVPESVANPTRCHEVNVHGMFNMLEAARHNKVKTFVYASSAAVYGQREGICKEDMQPSPTSPYGFSKLMNEIYAQQYSTVYRMTTIGLRYFNVYGPRQNPNGAYAAVVAKFTHQMQNNLPITIFGDGQQTRDFISVEQVVEANLTLATLDPALTNKQVFNIATGKSISLLELIDQLKVKFPGYHQEIQFVPARSGDIKHSSADCSKYQRASLQVIKQNLGYEQQSD
ncbi:MAG TPA: NAD-dependent epimerase/dehydratase family protein [Candidatus Dependentiae bacterium]|mgnify:CR=1 FL=1|nr:NAD-dependent epimerase/dehydratase family protein [Candidatus Dependentiae bacterium]HRQ62658.1 NAD-dependent epimerase/dehydratase family protein [Candidatus Dependentiae bacterium]